MPNKNHLETSMLTPFHLAYNVRDLAQAHDFYADVLGCVAGRNAATWIDFSFFGHQISLHLGEPFETKATGHVGEHLVPMPHLGVVLELARWHEVAQRLKQADTKFLIEPSVRFEGEPGEQWTMFFRDPSGNPIEIKGFADLEKVFAS
jgi:extradiol dioxygenase family protein